MVEVVEAGLESRKDTEKYVEQATMWRWRGRLGFGYRKTRKAQGHPKLEKAKKVSPLETLEGVWPYQHLIWDFRPPEMRENKFLWF